ncbi:hypothetical protein JCM30760_12030 [Thiomicrorhabdus hydrogeniphila]
MKKLIIASAVASSLSLVAFNASATDVYTALTYDAYSINTNSKDIDVPTATLSIATKLNPNFGLRLQLGVGVGDDTNNGIKTKVDNHYGIYATGNLPLMNDRLELFAMAGVAETRLNAKSSSNSATDSDSSFSWGVGSKFYVTQAVSVDLGYTSLYQDTDIDIAGFNLGLGYKF